MFDLRRRQFITLIGGAATWPLAAQAQQSSVKLMRIGVLADRYWAPMEALRQGLQDLGYNEGEKLRFEYRWAEGSNDRYLSLAGELLNLPVDAIVTWGTPATLAAQRATTSVPIVFLAGDPVAAGIVASLIHPGGNSTGFASLTAELEVKRLGLLKELLLQFSSLGVLANSANSAAPLGVKRVQLAAETLGVRIILAEIHNAVNLEKALLSLAAARPDAALVIADPFLVSNHAVHLAMFMAKSRLPAMYAYRQHVEAGGLLSYATDYHHIFRGIAIYLDKILRGSKPADLPIQQPTKFKLVINLKAAEALGLDIPRTLLALADQVIE
jgi:putative tryptophan/tyrosine transport system substrate-binding protein